MSKLARHRSAPDRRHEHPRMGYEKRLMVAAGRASRELGAQDRRASSASSLTDAGLKTFTDGEVYCRYEESIRGADIFIVQSIAAHEREGLTVNDALMELLLMVHAAKHASAHRIIAVTPVVRVLAPGQEVRAARADLRPPRGRSCSRWPASTGS